MVAVKPAGVMGFGLGAAPGAPAGLASSGGMGVGGIGGLAMSGAAPGTCAMMSPTIYDYQFLSVTISYAPRGRSRCVRDGVSHYQGLSVACRCWLCCVVLAIFLCETVTIVIVLSEHAS